MDLSGLLPTIEKASTIRSLIDSLLSARVDRTIGVTDGAKAATMAAALRAEGKQPTIVIAPRTDRAESLAEELAAWLGGLAEVHLFPERDPLPYERLRPDPNDVSDRLRLLQSLRTGKAVVAVTSGKALVQKTLSADDLARSLITVGRGSKLQPAAFLRRLSTLGYHQTPLVEQRGQVSRRGGILDVYPAATSLPTRIELVGDTVESLRQFDPGNQLSLTSIDSVTVGPAREAILTPERTKALEVRLAMDNCMPSMRRRFEEELLQLGAIHGFRDDYFYVPFLATTSLIDHLPQGSLLILEEGSDLETTIGELDQEAETLRREGESRGDLPYGLPQPDLSWPEIKAKIEGRHRRLSLSRWAGQEKSGREYRLPFRSPRSYGGRIGDLVDETAYRQEGRRILVSHQAQRLGELLSQKGREIKATTRIGESPPRLALVDGSLPEGWHLQDGAVEISLLTDKEIFGFVKQRRSRPQRRGPSRKSFLAELSPGDYVIHVEHGVGRFASLTTMKVETREREYLELHYADGDRLFVPTDQLDRLSRYAGPDGREPRLTRLNSGEWQRTKRRVQRAVEELAEELVSLYAARQVLPGHPHSHDTPWQAELEASFPYLETDDQLAAMTAVKEDMERSGPMDRLVSGDVGYGKTEVAVRAAFKSVMGGKQVAMLVPTTVLAQQHFQTFKERLAAFAPRIEMLSRFRTEGEQRLVIEGMATGGVDIVIGTHRLLQKDVRFKDLGLFIVDEEQRFGVAHKEYLKKMRQEVDVLTLSATPIPRTLYMALGGIRDMSTIETPPEDRLPIKTYVSEFNESLVREAIVRELGRGGQVYFVHNRVRSIDSIARRVEEAVPDATVAVAHGQMPEQQLERVMMKFAAGEIDVLVCTTIIESGLDIPNVNTIVINQANKLGLGQLYQLRGRVGRGSHRAYAYLLYDQRGRVTEAASKRLQAIFEATELGSGFQIALRDLEIRGAGNLLGPQQSGNMAAVGLELYSQLLSEAATRLKASLRGEPPPSKRDTPVSIDLPISAHIPESYIGAASSRLAIYQKLALAGNGQGIDRLEQEMADRFGPPPESVLNLLSLVRLRELASQARIRSIATENDDIVLRMQAGEEIDGRSLNRSNLDGLYVSRTYLRLKTKTLRGGWLTPLHQVLRAMSGS